MTQVSETIRKMSGGEGGIRTHVPELPDHPISSRRRYDHFGTSPLTQKLARYLYLSVVNPSRLMPVNLSAGPDVTH